MRLILLFTTIFLIADLIADTAIAQQMRIPAGSQKVASLETPLKGMSMQDVSDRFGQPEDVSEAVGEPPITIWHYGKFSVYFEKDTVLHSVHIMPSSALVVSQGSDSAQGYSTIQAF